MTTSYAPRISRGETLHTDRDPYREVTLRIAWEHESSDGVTPPSTTIVGVEVEEIAFLSIVTGKAIRHMDRADMSDRFARHMGELLAEQIGMDQLLEIVAEDRR